MELKKVLGFCVLSSLGLTFSMCDSEPDVDPDEALKESLVGGWYNEEHQEYDKFFASGSYYSEFPSSIGEGYTSLYGNYAINDGVLSLAFEFDGMALSTQNEIVTLTDYEMVWHDMATGDEYKYIKVIDEVNLNMGERIPISTITNDLTVYGFSFTQGVSIFDTSSSEIVGFLEGTGFVKFSTDKGDVMIRLNVTNDDRVVLPDFSSVLGMQKDDLINCMGTPYANEEAYVYYNYASPLVTSAMFMIDDASDEVYVVGVTLSKNTSEEDIMDYLNENYVFLSSDEENGTYIYVNEDFTMAISFSPSQSYMTIMSF